MKLIHCCLIFYFLLSVAALEADIPASLGSTAAVRRAQTQAQLRRGASFQRASRVRGVSARPSPVRPRRTTIVRKPRKPRRVRHARRRRGALVQPRRRTRSRGLPTAPPQVVDTRSRALPVSQPEVSIQDSTGMPPTARKQIVDAPGGGKVYSGEQMFVPAGASDDVKPLAGGGKKSEPQDKVLVGYEAFDYADSKQGPLTPAQQAAKLGKVDSGVDEGIKPRINEAGDLEFIDLDGQWKVQRTTEDGRVMVRPRDSQGEWFLERYKDEFGDEVSLSPDGWVVKRVDKEGNVFLKDRDYDDDFLTEAEYYKRREEEDAMDDDFDDDESVEPLPPSPSGFVSAASASAQADTVVVQAPEAAQPISPRPTSPRRREGIGGALDAVRGYVGKMDRRQLGAIAAAAGLALVGVAGGVYLFRDEIGNLLGLNEQGQEFVPTPEQEMELARLYDQQMYGSQMYAPPSYPLPQYPVEPSVNIEDIEAEMMRRGLLPDAVGGYYDDSGYDVGYDGAQPPYQGISGPTVEQEVRIETDIPIISGPSGAQRWF